MMEGLAFQADKALLDTVFDGVAVIDLKTLRVSLANQAAANILGFDSPDDMVGSDPLRHVSPDDREHVGALLDGVVSGNCVREAIEVRVLDKRGREIWITARGVKIASNGSSALLASFRDITAEKVAEMATREAERKQLELLDTSNEMIFISQGWKIAFANRRFLEATGLSSEALAGMSILDMVHPDDREAVAARYQEMMDGRFVPTDRAFRGIAKDGKPGWGLMREVPFTWRGKPAVMTLVQDITEQRDAEEALKSGVERYRYLLENANESVLIIQDWKVAHVNRKFEEMIGVSRESLAGLNILDLTHPDDRQAVSERYQRIMSGEKYSSGAPLRGLDKDGKTRWADVREIPFIWEGKPAVLSMMVDITERKAAEEALAESERRYRLVADNASDVIWTTDMSFNVTYMSPSAARLLRCSMAEAMTLTIQDMLTPESLTLGTRAFQDQMALEGKEGVSPQREWTIEVQMQRRDGTTVWVEEKTNFIRDADGRPTGLMGITREVSERKAAQAALEESEEKYRLLTEKTKDLIWTADVNLCLTYMSPSIERVLGFTARERLGRSADSLMTPASYAKVQARIQEEIEAELQGTCDPDRTIRIETEYYHKNGATVWMENLASAIRDKEGRIVGIHGVSRDVTERRQADIALRESEEKFKALVENSAAVVFSVNDQGIVNYVSPTIEGALGFSPSEIIGKTSLDFALPEDLPGLMESMAKTLGGHLEPYEFRVRCKSGAVRHILTSSRPVHREGRVVGLIGVMVDITEKKAAEDALRASEANYRTLFDHTVIGVAVVDAETMKVVLANHSSARMFGFKSPEDMVGKEPLSYVLPEDLDWVVAQLSKALSDPAVRQTATLRARTEDGRIVWVTGTATHFEYVRRPSILLTLVEVTAAKEAELKMAESEEKNRLLVDNAAEGIIVIQDGALKFANPKCVEISGYTREELLARSFLDIVHPDDCQMVAENHVKRISGEEAPNNYVFRIIDKAGNTKWLQINAVQFTWEGRYATLSMLNDVTAGKQAGEALRASEEKYRTLYEDNPSMYFTVDPVGTVLSVNQFGCEQLGYAAEELLHQSVLKVFHEEDKAAAARSVALCVEHLGEVFHWELRKVRKSGSVMWVKETARAARSSDGKAVVFIVCEDVSARKQAEEALRTSEEKYRGIFDESVATIFVFDMQKRFIGTNQAGVDLLGYSREELLRMSIPDVDADPVVVVPAHQELLTGGRLTNYEHRLRRKDGRIITVLNNSRPLTDSNGHVVGMQSTLIDVTERRRAEDALRDSENRYRLIAENSSDVIWTMDMNLRITYVSPSIEKLTGYSVEESRSMNMESGLTQESLDAAAGAYARGLADLERNGGRPASPETLEVEMKRKDGTTVWTEVQMSFMQDSEGRVVGMMGLARNINERRRARKALEESEERFRALIEGARDAIAVIDVNGKVTYSSPTAERMMNGSTEDLLTTSLSDGVHPDDVGKAAKIFEALASSPDGTMADVELRYRRDDDSWGVIEARATNRFHDPKIAGIVVNYRDITERRQAEKALRESDSRYRLLAENVSDVIWSVNLKSGRSFFSPSVTRLLGYTMEEAQSMKMKEVVSPTSYPRAMMAFSRLSTRESSESDSRASSTQLEIELMRKEGSFVWVDISVTLLRDADGQPSEIFGVMRDVTQRKRIEESLRTSEEYFRALIENAWDAIAIVDADGKMLYESPSSARIMGYEPEEIVGRNLGEFVRPQDVTAIVDAFRKFRTEPAAILMVDAGFRHKDGHYIECEGTLQNFLHDPKINGIVANYRDVTDRRNAEEAIRTSEERFRNLVEATSDFVWEVDPNGIYTYVSPKIRDVMGYEIGEIIGKSIFDSVPSKEVGHFSKIFNAFAAKKEPFAFVESSRLHKDGRVIIIETSGVPFFGDDGTLLGYRGIGRDITARRKVEKDLENSLKKVERTMEAAIQAISYTMETRDPYTTGHQKRVTQLACAIAKEMGLAAWRIDGIRVAGLLHDIGKIAVPTEILSKPGKLSDIEFSMIKSHPKVGFDILKNVEFDWPIARIVVQHHERLDGSGYPYGIPAKDILLEAKILAVADVVEAMSSHRPYRPALGIDRALAEVSRGEGTLYDSEVVRACSRVINQRGFKFEG